MMMNYSTTTVLLLFAVVGLLMGCSSAKQLSPDGSASAAELTESYSNTRYELSLSMPESWILLEERQTKTGDLAINLFARGTNAEQELPLDVHTKPTHSYIAIWPKGIGTELPPSDYAPFHEGQNSPELHFEVDSSLSKVLKLKGGSTWAYFIVPKDPPAGWSENGFIFAQIRTTNNSVRCYEQKTGRKIPIEKCDFLEGDRFVRLGVRDAQDVKTIHQILESIRLEEIQQDTTAADMIEVARPLPNMDVTSPLTIKGKARGSWYFEGRFTIKLYDAYGNLLAETTAKAQDSWMTEQFVPFKTTISFDAPDDQRGRLVFLRANPSGKPENAQSYSIPVIFPPE